MNRKTIHAAWVLLLIVAGVIWLALNWAPPGPADSAKGGQPSPPGPSSNSQVQLRWGNPSGAKADAGDRNNYLMEKPYFALSYNDAKGTPNWVSWRLVKDDLGHAERNQQFRPDDDLPAGFKKVLPSDYTESGFDRGHMCPYADRESTEESRPATFIMTNAVPQSPANNRQAWERFESYCRNLVAHDGKELYIVAGPAGQGGIGEKGAARTIGRNAVVVPAVTWKVVMVLSAGGTLDRNTRLIAVVIPNDQTVDENWAKHRTSVKAVEKLTGYTFFGQAPADILEPLKEKVDDVAVPSS
ncbi:MAG TPA: DNA/RNA non-specific endonuclease [Gemmataceae bacterium]|nr:DNA/RNA non-specific endonuclease [Gemmataceae bacterium]